MPATIVYHANCPDGFTAAWIAHKALGGDVRLWPAFYADEPPTDFSSLEEPLYILDFCYRREQMAKLIKSGRQIILIDHHRTTPGILKGLMADNLTFVFDLEQSGAMLTWYFFHSLTRPPRLVRYVQDFDLYRLMLPNSKALNLYIRSFDYTIEQWNALNTAMEKHVAACTMRALTLQHFTQTTVNSMLAHTRIVTLGKKVKLPFPIVNASCHFSEVGEMLLAKFPVADGAGYYFDRVDSNGRPVRQWGLRSRGKLDVSELAKEYGGGGHHNAAGFETKITFCGENVTRRRK